MIINRLRRGAVVCGLVLGVLAGTAAIADATPHHPAGTSGPQVLSTSWTGGWKCPPPAGTHHSTQYNC